MEFDLVRLTWDGWWHRREDRCRRSAWRTERGSWCQVASVWNDRRNRRWRPPRRTVSKPAGKQRWGSDLPWPRESRCELPMLLHCAAMRRSFFLPLVAVDWQMKRKRFLTFVSTVTYLFFQIFFVVHDFGCDFAVADDDYDQRNEIVPDPQDKCEEPRREILSHIIERAAGQVALWKITYHFHQFFFPRLGSIGSRWFELTYREQIGPRLQSKVAGLEDLHTSRTRKQPDRLVRCSSVCPSDEQCICTPTTVENR